MTMAWSQHVEHHLAARALDEHGQLLRRAAHHELARRGTHLHTGPPSGLGSGVGSGSASGLGSGLGSGPASGLGSGSAAVEGECRGGGVAARRGVGGGGAPNPNPNPNPDPNPNPNPHPNPARLCRRGYLDHVRLAHQERLGCAGRVERVRAAGAGGAVGDDARELLVRVRVRGQVRVRVRVRVKVRVGVSALW